MRYRVVYETPAGDVVVLIPAASGRQYVGDRMETDEEIAERVKATDVPTGTSALMCTTRDLPTHRHFRNAWALDIGASKVNTNMTKARDIHRDKIREARASELERLDIEYTRADEQGNNGLKAQIAQQKQQLRDLPQDGAIELASTPAALMAAWPEELANPYT